MNLKQKRVNRDKGMTMLEVIIAFIILLIGVGFILQTNKVYFGLREDRQARQQMIYYAAGQMEALLEGETVSYNQPPFDDYGVNVTVSNHPTNSHLEIIRVEVFKNGSSTDPSPVSICTYRVRME